MKNEHWNYSPFRGDAIDQFAYDISLNHAQNPDRKYVVRWGQGSNQLTRAKVTRNEFNLLNQFGISVVPTDFVITEKGLTMVSNFVDGLGVDTASQKLVDELVAGLMGYFEYKFENRSEPFLWDIDRSEQYVYGSVKGGKNKIYLVDVDARYYDPETKRNPWDVGSRDDSLCEVFYKIRKHFVMGTPSTYRKDIFNKTVLRLSGKAEFVEHSQEFAWLICS